MGICTHVIGELHLQVDSSKLPVVAICHDTMARVGHEQVYKVCTVGIGITATNTVTFSGYCGSKIPSGTSFSRNSDLDGI